MSPSGFQVPISKTAFNCQIAAWLDGCLLVVDCWMVELLIAGCKLLVDEDELLYDFLQALPYITSHI